MLLQISQSQHENCPNTKFFLVRIQSESGKIRTRKTSCSETFHAVNINGKSPELESLFNKVAYLQALSTPTLQKSANGCLAHIISLKT